MATHYNDSDLKVKKVLFLQQQKNNKVRLVCIFGQYKKLGRWICRYDLLSNQVSKIIFKSATLNEDGSEEQELEVKFCLFSQTKYFFAKVAADCQTRSIFCRTDKSIKVCRFG